MSPDDIYKMDISSSSALDLWTRETKLPHAVWAAGRGLSAILLPNFDVVDNLWLEPLSWQNLEPHHPNPNCLPSEPGLKSNIL
ncbi:putative inactive ATP-dependent zinc metalloprotease FTSHI 5, chloroplastic [Vitis vinifera]|uniref:Putative inactive ATP-dependent zinc metalloprotease FTSHI 5, chloroplastic n=1 Tax=Vitis vinifera TaxID=29760 RepID=A0A438IGW8_VITVI|nr:putative inactive ATP-dependent zinc metalloprotease FTSHI 5, chloroplastic [Vitis vinifera]